MPRHLSFAKFTVETCCRKLKDISPKQPPCSMSRCLPAIIYQNIIVERIPDKKKHDNLSD